MFHRSACLLQLSQFCRACSLFRGEQALQTLRQRKSGETQELADCANALLWRIWTTSSRRAGQVGALLDSTSRNSLQIPGHYRMLSDASKGLRKTSADKYVD